MRRAVAVGLAGLGGLGVTVGGCGEAPPADPGPGIPLELARERAERVDELAYALELRIPPERTDPIGGRVTIRFRLTDAARPLALDFAPGAGSVRAVRANGTALPGPSGAGPGAEGRGSGEADRQDGAAWREADGHLILPAAALRPGTNEVAVEFAAGDGPLNRTEDYLYTLFVPDRAHRAFPCFDQPDLKARWSLALDLPEGWTAVANGAEASSRPLEGGGRRVSFAETEPISTYLFAFAAGRFRVEEAERDGRRLRLFHRETDEERVERNRETIFDLHARALAWLEDYTEIPYPFGKFDAVAIPSFQYNGMEHPGAILYRAETLFLEPSATQNEELGRASVIAHETAHMWFGDLVTMRWFDDVWMKEVFANFMAAKIVHPSFPKLDHDLRFLLAHQPAAYAVDRTAGAHPIRQELENLAEAGTLYGAIIYQKAPVVMRQLELLLGEEAFRDGLRAYLRDHAFGNASWTELVRLLDARSETDVSAWSRVWVEEAGRPTVAVEARVEEGRLAGLTVEQSDPAGRDRVWNQRLGLRLGWEDSVRRLPVRTDAPRVQVPEAGGLPAPRWILPDGDGLGYGLFRLDEGTRTHLLGRLPELEEPRLRAAAWLALWDAMLEGRVGPEELADLAARTLAVEEVELAASRVLGDLRSLFWRFLDEEARRRAAPELEALLWRRVEEAPEASLKAAFFGAYRSVALTDGAVERLRALWEGSLEVEGLPLSERDHTRLAQELAVREADGWREVLDRQRERIENPDRRARFDFVRPALSADTAARDGFFASLAEPENRSHEPWVLEGVGWLHHPLRAEHARRYLRPALEMLEEIQATGDIFFPKRWLDATLGGHASSEAADAVRAFLADRPELPPRLRGKLLQSADPLFRAAALREAERGARAAAGG